MGEWSQSYTVSRLTCYQTHSISSACLSRSPNVRRILLVRTKTYKTTVTVFFDKPTETVTLSITLTLLFRSVGALIFGLLSDRFGRKWPLVINMIIISALSLGKGATMY